MRHLSITPSITVTIGRHTRQYFAFVTTAPAELDSPATMTSRGIFGVAGFAAIRRTTSSRRTPARLVLVDAMEPPGSARHEESAPAAPDQCSSAPTPCSTGSGTVCRHFTQRVRA